MCKIIYFVFVFIYSTLQQYVMQNILLTQKIILSEELNLKDEKDQMSFASIIDSAAAESIPVVESSILVMYQKMIHNQLSISISPIWILRKLYIASIWTKMIFVQVMLGNMKFVQKPRMVFGHDKYQEVSCLLLGYAIEAIFITHGSYYPPFRVFGMGGAVSYASTVAQVWLYCFACAMIERPNPWQ